MGGRRVGLLAHACPGPGRGGWPGKAPLAFGVSPRAASAFHAHPVLFMEEERSSGREGGGQGSSLFWNRQPASLWQAGGLIFCSLIHSRSPLGGSQPGKLQEASKRPCEGRRGESPTREDSGPPFALRCSSPTSVDTHRHRSSQGKGQSLPPGGLLAAKHLFLSCRSRVAFIPLLLLLLSLRSFGLEMQLLKGASSASPGLK